MLSLDEFKSFEWDKGNVNKSYQKHGITPNEAEEAFLDEKAIILKDAGHSQKEERYILVGKTAEEKLLFVVFALRSKKIRIISARKANRKEKNNYVKTI
ncbi:BrnT family toxin [Patescibacteria group bacterium]|nr:BrnT family toxin [Patescibacteria group bacterium]